MGLDIFEHALWEAEKAVFTLLGKLDEQIYVILLFESVYFRLAWYLFFKYSLLVSNRNETNVSLCVAINHCSFECSHYKSRQNYSRWAKTKEIWALLYF